MKEHKLKKAIPEEVSPEVQAIMKACLSHAEDLLNSAEKILDDYPNIAYHLSTLSLEEIGKATLVLIQFLSVTYGDEQAWALKYTEDHVKKLFWALWGHSFGNEIITKEQIDSFQGMSIGIHETRIKGLYVPVDRADICMPKEAIPKEQAENIISIARARLEIEKIKKFTELPKEKWENMVWFLSSSDDPLRRPLIFGRKSFEKLAEFGGNVANWVQWLKEQFDKAEIEGKALAEQELKRPTPSGAEADKLKWEMTLRLFSNSHKIKQKHLNWWNGVSNWLKLFAVDKKKNELHLKITLMKSVPIQNLWWIAWGISRRFVVALNIGSLGFFWWYVPNQISRYYEKIIDLETNTEIGLERSPILKLDWQRDVLSDQDLKNAALCFGMLPGPNDKEKHKPFDNYLTGLCFLSKNDIHLQFETNAYEQFYKSLKNVMLCYGDWNGITPFREAFDTFFSEIMPDSAERKKYIDLGEQFEAVPASPKGITLSEAGFMKIFCDGYYLRTFNRLGKDRALENKTFSEDSKSLGMNKN